MALRVMPLDMFKLRRLPETWLIPIQIPHPLVNRRIPAPDVPDVALEVLDIHGIEADDRRIEAHVGFGDGRAVVVGPVFRGRGGGEVVFDAVEGLEELGHGGFVGGLRGGEARAVDAVVDVWVRPFVGGFDFLLEVRGIEVDVAVLLGEQVVELVVEHADDLGGFVGHDGLVLFVVEGRDGEAAVVVGVHGEVDVAEVREVGVEGVGRDLLAGDFVGGGDEAPAWGWRVRGGVVVVVAARYMRVDIPLSSISQCTLVKGMMSSSPFSFRTIRVRWAGHRTSIQVLREYRRTRLTPWTSIADVEMIAILLRRELSAGLLGDPVSKRRWLPLELA